MSVPEEPQATPPPQQWAPPPPLPNPAVPPPPAGEPYPQAYGQPYGQPYPQAFAPPAPLSGAARGLGWALLGVGLLTAVAAFLPWVSVFGVSVSGIGGDVGGTKDGVITLPLGLLVAGAGLARALSTRTGGAQLAWPIVALVLAALVALIAVVDISDVESVPFASTGFGLVLTLIGGLAGIGVAIAAIVKRT